MNSEFDKVAEPGTGLPPRITTRTVYTRLMDPMILELVHLTEVGISAFTLDEVREQRDRAYRSGLASLMNGEGTSSISNFNRIEGGLPKYPRKCLKLFLTDGVTELQALECEVLPDLALGETQMGVKVHFPASELAVSIAHGCAKVNLENVTIIGGVAFLRKENVLVLQGANQQRMDAHVKRFYLELRSRMQQETLQAKVSMTRFRKIQKRDLNFLAAGTESHIPRAAFLP